MFATLDFRLIIGYILDVCCGRSCTVLAGRARRCESVHNIHRAHGIRVDVQWFLRILYTKFVCYQSFQNILVNTRLSAATTAAVRQFHIVL
jgi:hypothetical protein